MDEKGFMIGVIGRSNEPSHGSNGRSVVVAVCADGSSLPLGLIYQSANRTLQSAWVADITPGVHDVFTALTPSGWTNNDVGLAWLEQVFDRNTKKKARHGKDWRLLP
jgi:hypothetical protein